MQAQVVRKRVLAGVPAASGIDYYGGNFYVIGDNVPYVSVLDAHWQPTARHPIFTPTDPFDGQSDEVIPKPAKPDLEASTLVTLDDAPHLLLLGSGSMVPQRDRAFLLPLPALAPAQEVSLTVLYDFLRSLPEVSEGFRLNVEAACAAERLHLFHRGNVSGNNVRISYALPDVLHYLRDPAGRQIPIPRLTRYELPRMEGYLAGFSGATTLPDNRTLLFTASVEQTDNELDDGPTLGSFVGMIDLKQPNHRPPCAPVMEGDRVFLGKVESIAALEVRTDGIRAVAVTDSDGSDSLIVELWITL